MNYYETCHYSECLNRDMYVKVYGHFGLPIIVFPCQNGNNNDWPSHGMIELLSDYIEDGKIKLYCIDSVDQEGWSDVNGDPEHRSWIIEQYYYYVVNELVPEIREDCQSDVEPFLMGCSMGANHAATMFLRRPDLFSGMLSMSSVLDVKDMLFGSWCDARLSNNICANIIAPLSNDHYYIDLYNNKKAIFCIGQGAWEAGINSMRYLQGLCEEKGIHMWFDYWGYDVCHDWDWWKTQVRYFLPKILY